MRKGEADSQKRWYAFIQPATVAGMAPTGSGTSIRAASYNVRLATKDTGTSHNWADRTPRIADNLNSVHPAIVAMQEMLANMWTSKDGGTGLATALQRVGMGSYQLTRKTPWSKTVPMDARILYDNDQLQLMSRCDDTQQTCGIPLPGGTVAAYGLFRDRSSGEEFWFVSAHLRPGDGGEQLRADEAQTIVDAMADLNRANLPVIYGADMNSFQTNGDHNLPHGVFTSAGYYDTSAAVKQVNLEYNTVNQFASPEKPSPNGFGARVDVIMTQGLQGASRFEEVRTGSPYPSDHNMVYADMRLSGN
jgi:endonuclease/exonuclease/phosphatase family metal-dependent hydrolase